MVPHSWILEYLKALGIDEDIRKLGENSMKTWSVELTCGSESLGDVRIKRGIFQADSVSPLLFVACLIPLTYMLRRCAAGYEFYSNGSKINYLVLMDDLNLYAKNEQSLQFLVQTVRTYSNDIEMEFRICTCTVLTLKKR